MTSITLKACALVFAATPVTADIEVTFREGAPVDRFIIENIGSCDLGPSTILIDLSQTNGALIFDVTADGDGVEVFQPIRVESGGLSLPVLPEVNDGDNTLNLDLAGLPAGQSLTVTVDIDDTIGAREITVSGSEFVGATVQINDSLPVSFATEARPIARLGVCG